MYRYFLLCFFIASVAIASQNDYESRTVVIKVRQEFTSELQQFRQGSHSSILQLVPLLGVHSVRSFIRKELLDAMYEKVHSLSKSTSRSTLKFGTDRIFVVEYQENRDANMVASKLRGFPFVEYAEPMYKRNTCGIPNDPQATFQYHLQKVDAFSAWDQIVSEDSVIIGIVDTGIDTVHEDLVRNIWHNRGEMGLDAQGNDKSTNGIDDDNNNFVDDVVGWDFASDSFPVKGDNNPAPGNEHGTHVAGIAGGTVNNAIGIAGVGNKVKVMAVKIGDDNPFSTGVKNGFDGIVYAATNGAKVINCSWGGNSFAQSEQDVINDVVSQFNVIIVAAAGNSSENVGFYPASYDNVISVASTRQDDRKSDFSNYFKSVDISAPGTDIYSTIPNNGYRTLSGTSMASPVVAGAVALVVLANPKENPEQISERIKATTDNIRASNINSLDFLMGSGRLNVLKAVTKKDVKAVITQNVTSFKNNNDTYFYSNDTVNVKLDVKNVLSPLQNATVSLMTTSPQFLPIFLKNSQQIGALQQSQVQKNITFSFVVPTSSTFDQEVSLLCQVKDNDSIINESVLTFFINPTYRTITANNISTTINSIGNIGFNDYSNNLQGVGFLYKNRANILFESALIAASSPTQLSNVARGFLQESADRNFVIDKVVSLSTDNNQTLQNLTIAHAEYSDRTNLTKVGVEVSQKVFQSSNVKDSNFIISVYNFKNNSPRDIENFHAGLFFDWDIGPGGTPNVASFRSKSGTGIVTHARLDTFPIAGVRLLSPQKLNFFAIDNDGNTNENPGIYDGFSTSEKWRMLSSGVERILSNQTDASFVIGAGPMKIPAFQSVEVAFSIGAGFTVNELDSALDAAKDFAQKHNISTGEYNPPSSTTIVKVIYPNPTLRNDGSILEYELDRYSFVKIDIIDNLGRIIKIVEDTEKPAGEYSTVINTSELATGVYFVRFHAVNRSAVQLLQVQ